MSTTSNTPGSTGPSTPPPSSNGNGNGNGSGSGGDGSGGDGSGPGATIVPFRYSTRFKIVATLILVVVAVMIVVAYGMASSSDDENQVGTGGTREFVESLMPPGGSQLLQQGTVAIDLVTGWTGELSIDDTVIPAGQLDQGDDTPSETVPNGLERISYTPGPDKVLEALPLGPVCAQAVVWERSAGRANSQRTVSWCFEVI
jgi:hypothetical protein